MSHNHRGSGCLYRFPFMSFPFKVLFPWKSWTEKVITHHMGYVNSSQSS
jgi:hypothetical protein